MMAINLGPHAGYIIASYVVFFVVLVGLVVWIRLDGRSQLRQLADLNARGIRRRSAAADKEDA